MTFSGVNYTRERWYVCFFSFLYTRLIVIIATFIAFIVLFSRLQVLVVFKTLSLVKSVRYSYDFSRPHHMVTQGNTDENKSRL